jgi:hypothetical protein
VADDGRPIDDDVLALLGWFGPRREPETPRDHIERSTERRGPDRRGLGFTARRRDEAERNRQLRVFLLDYFRRLPHDDLLTIVDGLWLGLATDAQLVVLLDCAKNAGLPSPPPSRTRGRPRVEQFIPGDPPLSTRYEWRVLTDAFKDFRRERQQHHARVNRTRMGTPRSKAHREACLASPLGQWVDRAGLFVEFFDAAPRGDTPALHPTEMAARLLHHEWRAHLTAVEAHARTKAAHARSDHTRAMWTALAAKAAAHLKQFPTWKTLYRKLKQTRGRRTDRP